MATWVLTGSLENFRVYAERGFDVIGFKERRRRQAAEVEPGDEITFYVTKSAGVADRPAALPAFAAIARVRSELYEDREPFLPEGKRKAEAYPWRVEAEPVIVLPEERFVAAEELVPGLEHVRKWPAEHWHLAFQGQLRTVGEADATLIRERLAAALGRAGARA